MKPLQITKHKTNLTNILIDIYKDRTLTHLLGFKGGTAAMLFHNLPRFSVDLDFDLIKRVEKDSTKQNINKKITNKISKIISNSPIFTIKDHSIKFNTLFWALSYEKGAPHIKIEISTRDNPFNRYESKKFYGVNITVLDIRDMIAHKMVASIERKNRANRDLFDMNFFLNSQYASEINYKIIKHRTKKYPNEFYESLINFVRKIDRNSILAGLGEVLDQSQKDQTKATLLEELLSRLKRQRDFYPSNVVFKKIEKVNARTGDFNTWKFKFLVDNREITFPISISKSVLAQINNLEKSNVEKIFKNKIKDFLMLNPIGDYTTKPILTYDLDDDMDLSKFQIENLVT